MLKMVSCPICKSIKTKRYYSDNGLTLLFCKHCKVKFQHPMPSIEALNKVYSSNYYNSFYPEKNLGEQKLLFKERLHAIEAIRNGKKGKVLDIGSGRGTFIEAAKECGWSFLAQELSQDAARDLQKRLGIEAVICNKIEEARLSSESFDFINLNHVLEHLYEPAEAVKEIHRLLKPGGIFYCEVPRQNNFLNLLSNIFGKKDFGFSYLPEHLFLFEVRSIKNLFKESGFKVLKIKIEGLGDAHRYVKGVHYNSFWTDVIVRVVGGLRLQVPLGGGNLVAIGQKT